MPSRPHDCPAYCCPSLGLGNTAGDVDVNVVDVVVCIHVHVVYIGNESHGKLSFVNEFIEIPFSNIWLQREELMELIRGACDDTFKVFCFSAGMAANVFIHESWNFDKTNIYPMTHNSPEEYENLYKLVYEEPTVPGRFIVFPPTIMHRSTPNKENCDRITLAANWFPTGLVNSGGVSHLKVKVMQ